MLGAQNFVKIVLLEPLDWSLFEFLQHLALLRRYKLKVLAVSQQK